MKLRFLQRSYSTVIPDAPQLALATSWRAKARAWLFGFFLAAVCLPALCVPALRAHAQPTPADRETARTAFDEGVRAEQRGDLPAAERFFRDANNLVHVPSTALFLARVLAKQNRLLEARDAALEASRSPILAKEDPFQGKCRAEAVVLSTDLEARVPSLRIRVVGVDPAAAALSINGAPVPPLSSDSPRKLNPGTYVVSATAPGSAPVSQTLTLAERESKEVTLTLGAGPPGAVPPPPAARSKPSKVGPLVLMISGFGLGGASLITGAVTGGLALNKTDELRDACNNSPCPPAYAEDFDEASTLATVSDITLIVGGVLAAAGAGGAIWLALLPTGSQQRVGFAVNVLPSLSPDGAVVPNTYATLTIDVD